VDLLPAVLNDAFSLFSWPLGNVAGEALKALLKRRADAAQEIILEEISKGSVRFSEVDADEGVAIVFRYLRAAQEGTARVNLRLMAQVMCGQAKHGPLKADDFLYYADTLASLRTDELHLIGELLGNWNRASHEQDRDERMRAATIGAKEALVPKVFADASDFQACADGLRRTGYFLITATFGSGDLLGPSPLLLRLAALVDFEAARA